ncbi:hypothetical protein M0R45_002040 [Rubus argutus]|uniref:Uncharacterized protein n=1 Tax=Rubus argutus TaxID=59490 RepID=A0AAW1VKQ0_RUBAR
MPSICTCSQPRASLSHTARDLQPNDATAGVVSEEPSHRALPELPSSSPCSNLLQPAFLLQAKTCPLLPTVSPARSDLLPFPRPPLFFPRRCYTAPSIPRRAQPKPALTPCSSSIFLAVNPAHGIN